MGLTNGSTGPLMGYSDGPIGAPSMSNGLLRAYKCLVGPIMAQ